MSKYIPIIGLEVHVELKTQSKMFCSCPANYFGKEPNTHVCPVCLGLPGALPVPNKQALDWCVMIAMALNCEIATVSKFDRKNYFYPDLAKGYQISQYDMPFGARGWMQLSSGNKIGITRVHMEEDTGKLTHSGDNSLIDFNRSGLPLVEIVTEPDFHDAKDVTEYLQNLRQIVRYLGVSNADMEKGDMRLEPNISLTTDVNVLPKYKVEVKNINSFRFVEKAIEFEIKRHEKILENGETPVQETRGWNEDKALTFSQRIKEEANDYRYFPEPDIPPFEWTKEELEKLRNQLPELPQAKRARFIKDYELTEYNAEILTREIAMADYVEEAIKLGTSKQLTPKDIANWIINKKATPVELTIEKLIADIAASKQVATVDEKELEQVISVVTTENEKAVTDYKSGKESVIMFLVGQVMKRLSVRPDARIVKETLEKKIIMGEQHQFSEPIDLKGNNGEKSVVRESLEQVLESADRIKNSSSEYEQITFKRAEDKVGEIMGYMQQGVLTQLEGQKILAAEIAGPEIKGFVDSLTGELNENGVNMRLAAALSHAERTGEPYIGGYLDLKKFKEINDDAKLGHEAGDRALKYTAQYLKGLIRDDDFVGRLHGDEFFIGFTAGDLVGVQSRFQGEVLTADLARFVQDRMREEQEQKGFKGKVIDPLAININARIGFAEKIQHDSVAGIKQRADDNMNANRGPSTR